MTGVTCESKITGKTVLVRHATEGDIVFIKALSEKYGLPGGSMEDYTRFVVAAEDGNIIGFGSLGAPGGDSETITVLNERKERHISELIVKHLLYEGA